MSEREIEGRWLALIAAAESPVALAWIKAQINRHGLLGRLGAEVTKRAAQLEADGIDIEPYGLKGDEAA